MGFFSFLSRKNKAENNSDEVIEKTEEKVSADNAESTKVNTENKEPLSDEKKSEEIKVQETSDKTEEIKKTSDADNAEIKTSEKHESKLPENDVKAVKDSSEEKSFVEIKAENPIIEPQPSTDKDSVKAGYEDKSASSDISKVDTSSVETTESLVADKVSETKDTLNADKTLDKLSESVDDKSDTQEVLKREESNDTKKEESSQMVASVSEDETKVKHSFFERLKRTRENLAMGISALVSGKKIDEDLYEELETALLTADLGVETTNNIIEKLREESKLRELKDASALKTNLKNILKYILKPCAVPLEVKKQGNMPFVILMVGVNGAGKTTTIGKLALKYKEQGLNVMLAAGDTFRAAAVEQLKEWGVRTNTPVISQPTGSDSASVIFDALTSAKAHNTDVLICDTAGRLQNKDNLMEELKKIVRVMKKIDENVPNEVMLVLDSTTGQNAVSQMKIFGEAVNVSGLVLTKLDGTAKGGVIFALADKFKVPVRYVGIGESKEDLRVFDTDHFVDALFS